MRDRIQTQVYLLSRLLSLLEGNVVVMIRMVVMVAEQTRKERR